jgi:hypothetical protein
MLSPFRNPCMFTNRERMSANAFYCSVEKIASLHNLGVEHVIFLDCSTTGGLAIWR